MIRKILLFTVRKGSCRKVMFSQTCVKNSVHRGCVCTGADTPWCPQGVYPSMHWGRHPRVDTLRQTPPGRHLPLGRHPLGQTPLWADTFLGRHPPTPKETATAADGTHPTAMHSCYLNIFMDNVTWFLILLCQCMV